MAAALKYEPSRVRTMQQAATRGTGTVIQLCEYLSPRREPLWDLVKQCGVDNVVGMLRGAEQEQRMFASIGIGTAAVSLDCDEPPWSQAAIRADMELFASNGLRLAAIEDTPPMDKVRLGLPGRDEQIADVITQIKAMGALQVPVLCYNWMALSSWARTGIAIEGRGGALVTGFNLESANALGSIVEPGEVTSKQLWDGLQYFLDAVMPVAETAGVKLGLHPDDPPLPQVRNVPRIMSSVNAYRRLLDMYPSPSNGITLCQGNFTLMTDDLPSVIREFLARDAIAFVHFRDVHGDVEDFVETFHDEGKTDLVECMRAYTEFGYAGPMRPDHVPTMHGEPNDRPAYGTLGRLFAIGYIRGLQHAVADAHPSRARMTTEA